MEVARPVIPYHTRAPRAGGYMLIMMACCGPTQAAATSAGPHDGGPSEGSLAAAAAAAWLLFASCCWLDALISQAGRQPAVHRVHPTCTEKVHTRSWTEFLTTRLTKRIG